MEPTKQKNDLNSLSTEQLLKFVQQEEDDLKISLTSLFESRDASPTVYTEEETIFLSLPVKERAANLRKVHEQLLTTGKGNLKSLPVSEAHAAIKVYNATLKKVHEELLANGTENLKSVTTQTPKPLSQAKREQFTKVLHALTGDIFFKKIEVPTKETPINEEWVGQYLKWIENYQETVNELTKPAEQQTKAQKKLATPKTNTIMQLAESTMITSIPSKKGLADLPYYYQYYASTPETVIEYLFTNQETDTTKPAQYLFDLNNETHIELLEQTFSHYIDKQETNKIITLIQKCQCAAGELPLSQRAAGKLHDYLETLTRQEEGTAKIILKNKADEFVTKSNALVIALQEEFTKRVEELQQEFDHYQKDYNDTLEQKAAHMRLLKENTIATHALCSVLKLKTTECSDSIACLRSKTTKKEVYLTQEDVSTVYSNERLLNKMELSKPMAALQENTKDLLEHIEAINRSTHKVKLLT
jgi:hypothetical protein